MLHIILIILAMLPGTFCASWFTTRLVPFKRPLLYTNCVIVILTAIWFVNNWVISNLSVMLDMCSYGVWFLLLYLFSPRHQYARALFVQISMLLAQIFADFSVGVSTAHAARIIGIPVGRLLELYSPYYPLMCLICALWSCILMYLCVLIIRHCLPLHNPFKKFSELLWIFCIPLSQLVLINISTRLSFDRSDFSGISEVVILGVVFSAAADVACVLGYRRLRGLQRAEFQLQQIRQQLDHQALYYEELQQHILAINQVRHDLNNQLQTAYCLLEQGEAAAVREQLDVLRNSVAQKVGTTFCENIIVDAVLRQKADFCSAHQIPLRISTLVPAKTGIENSHLCSIFANLLDNGIHGIEEAGTQKGEILLRSDIQKDYLTIYCSNPAMKKAKKQSSKPWREHGLGLEILQHLAKKYQGNMAYTNLDGKFIVTMTLKLER